MTQKDMEARLIALEAEYAQKKLEADAQIRREQMKIDDVYMLGRPCGPMPVERRLTAKSKGEAPKCKTCIYFGCAHCCHEPMKMACEDYVRKKKKR